MDAIEIINQIGEKQGWNDQSKMHLLCRFIDYTIMWAEEEGTELSTSPLGEWLQNQADWENNEGLDAGRAPDA